MMAERHKACFTLFCQEALHYATTDTRVFLVASVVMLDVCMLFSIKDNNNKTVEMRALSMYCDLFGTALGALILLFF